MAPSKLRNAIGLVKDQTSIGLAKINNNSSSLSDLEIAIVKATRHEEYPAEEKHIKIIIYLTSYSRARVSSCVNIIARRLRKTNNWVVALKALMLIHRLLHEGDQAYEQEIYESRRGGTRLLNMFDFCDTSRSNSWDYSGFVRTCALYLDELLEHKIQGKKQKPSSSSYREEQEKDNNNADIRRQRHRSNSSRSVERIHGENNKGAIVVRTTPIAEMTNEQLFTKIDRLVQIIERFLACRPTGQAKMHRLVSLALYPIIKESFYFYNDVTELLGILFERFMNLNIPDSIKVHEIFCKCSKKFDEIDSFYCWTKSIGIVRASEYPEVKHISPKKLKVMDEYIKERSEILSNKTLETNESDVEVDYQELEKEPEEDYKSVKALPPPEEITAPEEKEEVEVVQVEEEKKTQEMGDLLNLFEDAPTENDHADQLALALFDGAHTTTTTGPTPWKAFGDSSDWETKLVETASHLSNQNATLPRGLDTLVLDGMYNRGEINNYSTSSGYIATGSASSVAFGSAGSPAMLALPAPPGHNGANNGFVTDPFAASLSVAPPPYVQMYDMEKKQRFLVEEQEAWKQYSRDGMQGQMSFAHMNPNYSNSYNMGGYNDRS